MKGSGGSSAVVLLLDLPLDKERDLLSRPDAVGAGGGEAGRLGPSRARS